MTCYSFIIAMVFRATMTLHDLHLISKVAHIQGTSLENVIFNKLRKTVVYRGNKCVNLTQEALGVGLT